MKTKSETKPTLKYEIQGEGERINVVFNDLDSIVEVQGEHGVEYEYWHYVSEMNNNKEYIKEHIDELFLLAKQCEFDRVASEVRERRKTLLEETDNYAMSDRVMSEEMKIYRQALRDIPEQEGFPYEVVYPIKPKE